MLYIKLDANKLLELLANKWETTKKFKDQIEAGKKKNFELIISNEESCYLLLY